MKENQHTEWKESWRDDFLKTICGFANAEGGVLAIGCNDKGKVVGVKDAKKLLEDLPNKVRDILGIMVDVNLRTTDGKDCLDIVVPAYSNPISHKGEYFYRSGSTTQTLKAAALDRFLMRKQGRHWDGVPQPHVTVDDLDARVLGYFRKQALKSRRLSYEILEEQNQPLLEKLHLTEGAYLTRAATLLFHPEPQRFFTGAYIKIGFFENNVDLRYQDEVSGDLFTQVAKTIETLHAKYLKAWISYEGLQRIETPPVPDEALREAVLNAVVHKDYGSGIPIQISVYPDKLMIWNPGPLPPDWTIEHLLGKHSSEPFNPDIANAFFRAGQIESWGRGIERIMKACAAAKIPKPEIRHETTGLWSVFRFDGQEAGTATTQETTRETTQETTREHIVRLLKHKPTITRKELAVQTGLTDDGIKYQLNKLKAAGRIRHVGSTKAGHWEILS